MVYTIYEHGRSILSRSRHDDLLGTMRQMSLASLSREECTCRLNDILCTCRAPVDVLSLILAEYTDLLAVYYETILILIHGTVESAEYGIVLKLIDHYIKVSLSDVNPADIKLVALLKHNAQSYTSDTSKTVNSDFNCHSLSFPLSV